MKSVQKTVDELRNLSEGLSIKDVRDLRAMSKQTRMFGEVFGIYGVLEETLKEKSVSESLESMSFEEKRKLYETQFPNQVSAKKRAKAREALNFLANNPTLFASLTASPQASTAKPLSAHKVFSSRSWPTSNDTTTFEFSEADLTAPRIRQTMDINGAVFPGVWKFGSYDNFSRMTYDAAYSNTTQSPSTVYDESSTPITEGPCSPSSVHTCIQNTH